TCSMFSRSLTFFIRDVESTGGGAGDSISFILLTSNTFVVDDLSPSRSIIRFLSASISFSDSPCFFLKILISIAHFADSLCLCMSCVFGVPLSSDLWAIRQLK
ncbi:hypothetical protein PFISCL1PPCAC_28827, partial [Pristionchus fissidentatus]